MEKIDKTEEQWQQLLTAEQFHILRRKGTEPPFSGVYCDLHQTGRYYCAGCNLELFHSDDKFDLGSNSFDQYPKSPTQNANCQ